MFKLLKLRMKMLVFYICQKSFVVTMSHNSCYCIAIIHHLFSLYAIKIECKKARVTCISPLALENCVTL